MKNRKIPWAVSVCALLSTVSLGVHALPSIENPSVELREDQYAPTVSKLIDQRRFDLAKRYIDAGLQINPMSLRLRYLDAVRLERQGKLEEATDAFEELVQTYPEVPEPYVHLASLCFKKDDLNQAEDLLKQALTLRPGYALAHENLGRVYLARARSHWLKAAVRGRGKLYQQLDKLDEIIQRN